MEKYQKLKEIAQKISSCQRCPLYKKATNPVPGDGNPEAEIVFIGEAPGYWEDQKGIPFCGAAGNLLDRLLARINIKREEVFITNILKHRPPQNRDPLPDEIKACTPFLRKQILIIKPKIIVTLGRFALNFFIPNASISKIHGTPRKIVWESLNLVVVPMFHPAAALRNGEIMAQIIQDFLKIPEIIENIKREEDQKEPKTRPIQESLF